MQSNAFSSFGNTSRLVPFLTVTRVLSVYLCSRSQSRHGSITVIVTSGREAKTSVLNPELAPISQTRVHLRFFNSGRIKLSTKSRIGSQFSQRFSSRMEARPAKWNIVSMLQCSQDKHQPIREPKE